MPSPLVIALDRALDEYASPELRTARFEDYVRLGRFVRSELRELGLAPLAGDPVASPVMTTFAPPSGWHPREFLGACRTLGYELAGASDYLRHRRLVQIATMGDLSCESLGPLFTGLAERLA
jgi:aspartate aminotransferase-like enzyme